MLLSFTLAILLKFKQIFSFGLGEVYDFWSLYDEAMLRNGINEYAQAYHDDLCDPS